MKPESQRIAIAEACGWKREEHTALLGSKYFLWHNGADMFVEDTDALPDYLNDLNAMHEAEKTLSKEQCYQYSEFLATALGHWRPSLGPDNWPFHATAAQRAEAFLRTLGKWTE